MIVNLPLQFKSIHLPEFTVKNYIDCFKASNRNSEEFIHKINALINEKVDIYSLLLIMLEWRSNCVSDKGFPFGSKREVACESIISTINKNLQKLIEDYPIGITKPYFHEWKDIGKDINSYSSSEDINNYPASILAEHHRWINLKYNKNNNYTINIYNDINLYPDKEVLFEFYKGILLPHSINYIYDVLSFLGRSYNFDGSYWESKTVLELEYFYTKLIKTDEPTN